MQAKKPDFKIFAGSAEDGELHDFPDVTRGWGVTKLQTNKKPPLSWMNGAFNRVDNNFYYLLQSGFAEWNSELEYYIGALTQVDGVIYRAKEASKGDNPTISTKWERMFSDNVGSSDFIGMSQKAIFELIENAVSVGGMMWSISPKQPKGRWLKMNGSAISRSAYKELFDDIGTLYGEGDGSTTFNLPDARGYFPRFWDDGRGIDSGRSFGSFQEDAIRDITGTLTSRATGSRAADTIYGSGAFHKSAKGSVVECITSATNTAAAKGFEFSASAVVPTASENRPKNIALIAWIKY